jgi:RNA polymerase sigma factor (sigma-70 family)
MTRLADLLGGPGRLPDPDADLLARFVRERDEAAFAEIVRRHGPTVWGACRRRLPRRCDAEDAFQATFLVLVRRAATAARHPAVGGWLHRTAVQVAMVVRRRDKRRPTVPLAREPAAAEPAPPPDVDRLLDRLPDKYRLPVVLCHLEGLSRREAAERLGVPEGTLSARLSRAVGRLRGLTAVAVPAGLAAGTVRAAGTFRAAAAGPSPAVVELTREVLGMGRWTRGLVGAAVLAGGMLAVGVARVASADDPPKPPAVEVRPPLAPPAADTSKLPAELRKQFDELVPAAVVGTVRDGDGMPVPDAEVSINGNVGYYATFRPAGFPGRGRTNKDGRYVAWFRTKPGTTVVITSLSASADGFIEHRQDFRYDEVKAHPDRPGEWDFVLARGEVLAGVVPGAKGTQYTPLLVRGPSFSREVPLDEEGRFRLWVPKGKYTLTAVLAEQRVRRDRKLADTEYSHGPVIAKAAVARDVPSGSDRLELK